MSSLEESLQTIASFLCPELVSPDAYRDLSSMIEQLPGQLAFGGLGFECRLDSQSKKADLIVRVAAASGGREDLLRFAFQRLDWNSIHAFARAWSDSSSPLYERSKLIWLEFDIIDQNNTIPSIFFAPGTRSQADHSDDLLIATMGLSLLIGGPLPPDLLRQLTNCFEAVPINGRVSQVGAMLSRQFRPIRLCIVGLSSRAILSYLVRIGWKGSIHTLQTKLAALSGLVEFLCLDIDVSKTGVGSSIGLECYCTPSGQHQPGAKWQALLDHLVEIGLCTAAKKEALLGFSGYSCEREDHLYPEDIRQAPVPLEPREVSIMMRSLHHVKLILRAPQTLEAKAYLGVWHE